MRVYLACLVAVAVLATACEHQGTLCMPSSQGTQMTVGTERIHNTGDEPVIVTNVVLVDAQGVSLIDSFVLPMPSPSADGSLYMVGTKSSFPPQNAGPDWDQRATAVGAIVGIKSDASSTFEKVTVEYKDSSGNRYEASTSTKIVIKPQCS